MRIDLVFKTLVSVWLVQKPMSIRLDDRLIVQSPCLCLLQILKAYALKFFDRPRLDGVAKNAKHADCRWLAESL